MIGPFHIIDDDNLTGYRIYREVKVGPDLTVVLRKYGVTFASLEEAAAYVEHKNRQES